MSKRDKFYTWWKKQHVSIRKPLVFGLGFLLIVISPLIGWIPGPGGIIVFISGIAVLASEFDWAEALKEFFLKTVPKEIKNRWRPTPRWEIVFDISSVLLILAAIIAALNSWWAPVLSFGMGGLCLFIFNRDRLTYIKKQFTR